jgi:hypothetical protein
MAAELESLRARVILLCGRGRDQAGEAGREQQGGDRAPTAPSTGS